MLNITRDLSKPQGIIKGALYDAIVVDNKDARHLGRVTARIPILFDGIEDAHLPWAIPVGVNHADGASSTSGCVDIPKIGTKVCLSFQESSVDHPTYSTYPVDETTVLDEALLNYPDRKVMRLQNSALVVYDTKTNELFIRNPGTVRIYVEGNCELEVKGNMVEKVMGNKTSYVRGNLTEIVDGNRTLGVKGTDTAISVGTRSILSHGADNHHAGGNMIRTAPYINDDLPGADLGSVPATPTFARWAGIRGNVPV